MALDEIGNKMLGRILRREIRSKNWTGFFCLEIHKPDCKADQKLLTDIFMSLYGLG